MQTLEDVYNLPVFEVEDYILYGVDYHNQLTQETIQVQISFDIFSYRSQS